MSFHFHGVVLQVLYFAVMRLIFSLYSLSIDDLVIGPSVYQATLRPAMYMYLHYTVRDEQRKWLNSVQAAFSYQTLTFFPQIRKNVYNVSQSNLLTLSSLRPIARTPPSHVPPLQHWSQAQKSAQFLASCKLASCIFLKHIPTCDRNFILVSFTQYFGYLVLHSIIQHLGWPQSSHKSPLQH